MQKKFFNENYPSSKDIKENVKLLDCNDKVQILDFNCFDLKKNINRFSESFDVIFMDPPFKEKRVNYLLEILLDSKLLKHSGLIILHHESKENKSLIEKFNIVETRIYGISKIIFGN